MFSTVFILAQCVYILLLKPQTDDLTEATWNACLWPGGKENPNEL